MREKCKFKKCMTLAKSFDVEEPTICKKMLMIDGTLGMDGVVWWLRALFRTMI